MLNDYHFSLWQGWVGGHLVFDTGHAQFGNIADFISNKCKKILIAYKLIFIKLEIQFISYVALNNVFVIHFI